MRSLLRILVLAAAGLIAACATGPRVHVDKDPAVDMKAYKTFAFFDPVSTDRSRYATLMSSRLKLTTRLQLERLGLRYDERNPDLRVNFFVNLADRQEVRGSAPAPGGFYRYRAGAYAGWSRYPYELETRDYKAGTLSIDLVDARTKSLVWQGLAEGKVKEEALRDPSGAIDAIVAALFRNFPEEPAA